MQRDDGRDRFRVDLKVDTDGVIGPIDLPL